jgi:hypothetical protein
MDEKNKPETPETDLELLERFDKYMRQELLDASNQYRQKNGLPLITEEEVADIDTLSALKARLGQENKPENG